MNTRRIASAAAIALAALIAAPAVALARPARAPLAHRAAPARVLMDLSRPQDARSYDQQARLRMRRAKLRIYRAMRSHAVPRSTQRRIFADLAEATRVLRQRITWATADGQVTAFERGQIDALVRAVAQHMTSTYGAIDSWQLM